MRQPALHRAHHFYIKTNPSEIEGRQRGAERHRYSLLNNGVVTAFDFDETFATETMHKGEEVFELQKPLAPKAWISPRANIDVFDLRPRELRDGCV